MNMSKQYGGKCCCCINLKTGCYLIAFILLIVHSAVSDMAVKLFVDAIMTKKVFDIHVNDPHLLVKFLAYLFFSMIVLAIAVTIVAFAFILMTGLYKGDQKYIGKYLIFGTIMLLVFVLICVIENFLNYLDLADIFERSVCITLNAYFIYMIKCYWITIYSHNEKEHELKMNMIGKAKEKIYSYMNLATACFVVAYFQLMLHVLIVGTIVHVLLLSKEEPVKDVESMRRVINFLLIGQLVFPIAVLVLYFTIMLIVGLHTKNRIRITSYVIFATLMLILIGGAIILVIYIMNKQFPLDLVLSITVPYALSIYLLRRYLKQLDPIDVKPFKEVV